MKLHFYDTYKHKESELLSESTQMAIYSKLPLSPRVRNYLMLGVYFLIESSAISRAQDSYWVFFSDKGHNIEERLRNKQVCLSPQALDRRSNQGVSIDVSDLPVYEPYIEQVCNQGISLQAKSRWFNGIVVEGEKEKIEALQALHFVKSLYPMGFYTVEATSLNPKTPIDSSVWEYGAAQEQVYMLGLEKLHELGFTGKGVRIAIFDGGFKDANTLKAFSHSWKDKKVLATYDFVRDRTDIFDPTVTSMHGTHVWSTIAAFLPSYMIGAAVDAEFILGITEVPSKEVRAEEYHWIEAMEWADSIGVDIIHSSLSYSLFDTEEDSYEFKDMDGNSTFVTRAADRAASKGIIVTTGAGNEGNDPWQRITAPCDGDSVLCIGAVNSFEQIAAFSSMGPSADGQVKPDVVAMGQETAIASRGNVIRLGSGTSYSSPIVAGLAACLRQGNPKKHAMDIIQAIQMSGDRYHKPDSLYGYGVPNALRADSLLRIKDEPGKISIVDDSTQVVAAYDSDTTSSAITLTDSPQSIFRIIAKNLSVKTVENKILETRIMQGDNQVFFPPSSLQKSLYRVVYDISMLLSGDYYVYVKTEKFEEYIPFSRR